MFTEATDASGQKIRVSRFLEIDPKRKILTFTEAKYTPISANWPFINLTDMRVATGEDALLIAEQNGGKDQRMKLSNTCYISVSIFTNARKEPMWFVNYSQADKATPFFTIEIDPESGDIH